MAEQLEDRTLLSVTSLWIDGELSIRSNSNDSILVETDASQNVVVQVNGVVDNSVPTIPASDVRAMVIEGGDLANRIDLKAVTSSEFNYVDAVSGLPMTVHIDGGNGNDTIFGSGGAGDTILGGDGDDFIDAREGADVITAGDGNDLVYAREGADSVYGGNGNDQLFGLGGDDLVEGGDGADSLYGGEGNDVVNGGDHADVIQGDDGDDTLNGESGADSIQGDAGNDSIRGGGASDHIEGNDGDDILNGQGSSDYIEGGAGNDSLIGGAGLDTLIGNDGNDRLSGSGGNDRLEGSIGDDSVYGGAGHDLVFGDLPDFDQLLGDTANNTASGTKNDVLRGQSGNDTIYGGLGADRIEGGQGNDLIESFLPSTTLVVVDDPVVETEGNTTSVSVFRADFEGGAPDPFTGFTSTAAVQGFAGLGTNSNVFAGEFLHNDSGCCAEDPVAGQTRTPLTLSDLPEHTSIDIDFLLAVINSWESTADSSVLGPDNFVVVVDGMRVFDQSLSNYDGTGNDYQPSTGVALTPAPLSDLGFPGPSDSLAQNDSAYNMGLDSVFDAIPHTASTLTIEWLAEGGWEGGADESWGIDNVEITLNGVPVQSTATFNVTLSHPSDQAITVDYATMDETATAGSDYVSASGTLTFPAGTTRQTVDIAVLGDELVEATETFRLNVTNAENALIGDGQGVATITDDDQALIPELARQRLHEVRETHGLSTVDIDTALITGGSTSELTRNTAVYLRQTYGGIEVQQADIILMLSRDGGTHVKSNLFVPGLNTQQPQASDVTPDISAAEALQWVADHFEWNPTTEHSEPIITTTSTATDNNPAQPVTISAGDLVAFDIPARLVWVQAGDTPEFHLGWHLDVVTADYQHAYAIDVDAKTGEILSTTDRMRDAVYNAFRQCLQIHTTRAVKTGWWQRLGF